MDRVTLEMKTVEEAIESALKMLDATRDEVDVIIEEEPSKGFLGLGAKEAKVTVVRKGTGQTAQVLNEIEENKSDFEKKIDEVTADAKNAYDDIKEDVAEMADKTSEKVSEFADDVSDKFNDAKEDVAEKFADMKESTEDFVDEKIARPMKSFLLEGADHYETEEDMAEAARKYLEKTINLMGFEGHVEIIDERDKGENLVLDIMLDDYEQNSRIIGKKGATIDALGYMVGQFVRGRYDERLMLEVDCGDYIYDQKEKLKAFARDAGERAIRDGEYRLRPMNAYDRRIVHKALNDMEGVSTHSEGEEPRRSIVITRDPQ